MKSLGVFRAILLAVYLLVPVIFIPFLMEQFELPKLGVMWAGVAALVGLISFSKFKNDKIAIGMLFFVISTVISAFFSLNPRISLFGNPVSPNGVTTALGYFGLYLVTRTLVSNRVLGWKFLKWGILPATVSAAYALVQFYRFDPIQWQGSLVEYGVLRPGATLGQPNFLGTYLVMNFMVLLGTKAVWPRRVRWPLMVLFLTVIVLTGSRGAWVALGVGLGVWLWFVNRVRISLLLIPFGFAALTPLLSRLLINSVITPAWPTLYTLVGRFGALLTFSGSRAEYLIGALRVWRRYPWLGAGTDAFQLAFEHQRTAHFWLIAPGEAPHRAHNEIFNVLATQGVFGLATLGLCIWAILCASRKLTRGNGYHGVIVAILVSFAVSVLSSLTVASVGVLAVLGVALLANEGHALAEVGTSRLKLIFSVLLTAVVVMSVGLRVAGSFRERVAIQVKPYSLIAALQEAEKAVMLQHGDENFVILVLQLSEALYNVTNDERYVALALRSVAQAVKLDPAQALHHYMFGLVLRQIRRDDLAEMEFRVAVSLEPYNPIYARRGL